jgi:hypothetical protein
VLTSCHGYRNASDHLDETHVDAAFAALKRHAFFGLLDAYNASVLLALNAFGIQPDENRDFEQSRPSVRPSFRNRPFDALILDVALARLLRRVGAAAERVGVPRHVFGEPPRLYTLRTSAPRVSRHA